MRTRLLAPLASSLVFGPRVEVCFAQTPSGTKAFDPAKFACHEQNYGLIDVVRGTQIRADR